MKFLSSICTMPATIGANVLMKGRNLATLQQRHAYHKILLPGIGNAA